jgi:hypothetical protein
LPCPVKPLRELLVFREIAANQIPSVTIVGDESLMAGLDRCRRWLKQTVRAVQSEIRGAKVSADLETGTISRISIYPIKSLPGVTVASSDVLGSGALKWDRRLALVEPNGEFVNLKRVPELHQIRADFQLDTPSVRLWTGHSVTARTFHLDDDRESLGTF